MSLLANGGRIVPILAAHEQHHPDSTLNTDLLAEYPLPQTTGQISLLDQQQNAPPIRQDPSPTRHKKSIDLESLEMPCLKEHGLFALPTEGDGNCLYYSLSDQLYGNFDHGDEIRQLLADHMTTHKRYFMQFVVAEGGERRRPKRAAVSAYATRSADVTAPSDEDKERRFEEMVATTRKNGEWGSSESLQAFCQVYQVDINVYTMDGVQAFRDVNASPQEHRDVIHVAFHDFKHYSSVRPLDRSHKGLFEISRGDQSPDLPSHPQYTHVDDCKEKVSSDIKEAALDKDNFIPQGAHLAPTDSTDDPGLAVDVYPPWDIQSIQDGLGGRYDRDTIVDMLQKCRGDIDRAFAALLDTPTDKQVAPAQSFNSSVQMSRESSPFSTGSKRSAEDSGDDSDEPRPAIRRGRPKKRMVSKLTLGVGISFRDDQNEVVSLNLRMKSDAEKLKESDSTPDESASETSESATGRAPRRSGRLSKPRPA
ncbi:hypothetical protein N7533_004437 [Penicillium manginii]|uniref:uncharacterized protein n=1 Tax=Penicillium manginii TaxID=203109 RepID=UPI002547E477|nr:uncharacterized protein N7533_004437 [Penicillium manginii]KAJ5754894.1 hypothetical protein N7533_004437 [Penicillium manginii]